MVGTLLLGGMKKTSQLMAIVKNPVRNLIFEHTGNKISPPFPVDLE